MKFYKLSHPGQHDTGNQLRQRTLCSCKLALAFDSLIYPTIPITKMAAELDKLFDAFIFFLFPAKTQSSHLSAGKQK